MFGSAGLKTTALQKIIGNGEGGMFSFDWKSKMEEGEACQFMQHFEMEAMLHAKEAAKLSKIRKGLE
jgi:hypothetical protein